jgi:peptide/nickel transport system substrate-binding protein
MAFAGGGGQQGSSSGVKDNFICALNAEPATLDGLLADDFVAYNVTNNLYDNLIIQEPDGSLSPGLAERWEYSNDNKQITFYLRKGVKFHDGGAFTADDVVYTFAHDIKHPPAANLTSAMDRMEKVDDYTCVLYLKQAFGPVEYCIAGSQLAIVSKAAREKNPQGFARNPVGTGPYKFVSWQAADKVVLTRFDDYWQGAPKIKDVTFKIIPETATAVTALEKGEVDMIDPVVNNRDTLMNNPKITWHETPQLSTYFVAMNNKRGLFSDINMRMVLAYGLDRKALLQGALDGQGVLCTTPMPPGIFGFTEGFQWYDYDSGKAKEYLAKAGYANGLTITFTTMNNDSYVRPTEIIQDQLRQIGITVKIDKLDRAAYLTKVITEKDYEVCVMSATAFYPDADYLYAMLHSDPTEKGRNYTLDNDPDMDRFLEQARSSQNPRERQEFYRGVSERYKTTAMQVPLYIANAYKATSANLKGYMISGLRRVYVKYLSWE